MLDKTPQSLPAGPSLLQYSTAYLPARMNPFGRVSLLSEFPGTNGASQVLREMAHDYGFKHKEIKSPDIMVSQYGNGRKIDTKNMWILSLWLI